MRISKSAETKNNHSEGASAEVRPEIKTDDDSSSSKAKRKNATVKFKTKSHENEIIIQDVKHLKS